jgi:hypothetical protein
VLEILVAAGQAHAGLATSDTDDAVEAVESVDA